MSGWNQYNEAAGGGGSFVKLNIGDTRRLQILDCAGVSTKTWQDGKTSQMVTFDVIDIENPPDEGEAQTLDCPVRRAAPLGDLRSSLAAQGIDLADRIVEIECYATPHPTRPGARIGRWRCKDTGAAGERWQVADAATPLAGYDGAHETAILSAASVDDVGAAFAAAYKATTDADARGRYREAATARKTEILDMVAAGAGADDIPNF